MKRNEKIRADAIIFDKDGTLIDFDAFWVSLSRVAINDVLRQLGQEEALTEEILEAFGVRDGVTDINGVLCKGTYRQMSRIVQGILLEHGCAVSDDAMEKLVLDAYNRNAQVGEVKPTCPNLREVLLTLKNRNKKIALVTTDNMEISVLCLRKLGVLDLFDKLYTDDGVLPVKPNPDNAFDFCAYTGLDKTQVVMVGDTMTDVRFARNAGIQVVGVAKHPESRALLAEKTDAVLQDVSGLLEILE